MAKKKKAKVSLNWLPLLTTVLGILSVILFTMLPMVKETIEIAGTTTVSQYSGFAMILGGEANVNWLTTLKNGTTLTESYTMEVSFNFLAFAALCLVLVATALLLASLFVKKLSNNTLVKLAAALSLVIGGVLMFVIKESCMNALGVHELLHELYSLAYGPIVSGTLAILAGLTTGTHALLKK